MARTESSFARPSVTRAISVHMARLIALRSFGRLITTVAIGPSCSTRMSVISSSSVAREPAPFACSAAELHRRADASGRRPDRILPQGRRARCAARFGLDTEDVCYNPAEHTTRRSPHMQFRTHPWHQLVERSPADGEEDDEDDDEE